jgi:hypothetical protein
LILYQELDALQNVELMYDISMIIVCLWISSDGCVNLCGIVYRVICELLVVIIVIGLDCIELFIEIKDYRRLFISYFLMKISIFEISFFCWNLSML